MEILRKLKKAYHNAGTILNYKTPMQFLTSVILSAQTTDEQVNKTTQDLFKKYKVVDDFIPPRGTSQKDTDKFIRNFAKEINSVNFYKNKAKYIVGSAKKIRDEYGGKLPRSIDEITKLPGVARKTANVVLYKIYGVTQGIAVDTHVKRVATNLGLSKQKNPDKIERDLMELFPKKEWGNVSFLFQAYGRTAMPARGKAKAEDPLKGLY